MRSFFFASVLLVSLAAHADGPATARRHMVATGNPLASEAANTVLRQGGSAVDAAIAAQLVLAVVEPQSSGLGGGSLMLVWDSATRQLDSLDGLASAPAGVPTDLARDADGEPIGRSVLARTGRVVGVPGTPRLLALAHDQFGKLPWSSLFADAITLADGGFPMPRYLHAVAHQQPELARHWVFGPMLFDEQGQLRDGGSTLANPALADTLRLLAADGPDAFYQGQIARDIVDAVGSGRYPGAMTLADLADYRAKERNPVCAPVLDHSICAAAAPASGGIALLQQLGIAERAGARATDPDSFAAAHLFLEASRLSRADRLTWIGDPDHLEVPQDALLAPAYLDARARLISPDRALASVPPGSLPGKQGSMTSEALALPATSHIAVVDDSGNAVSFTTTINLNFGAELVVDGMILNNALTNFAATPERDGQRARNAIAPGKRPTTTMAPSIVFDDQGSPMLVVGAGGGARIIDAVAQTILGVLAWHRDIRAAIEAPRIGAQSDAQELERGSPAADLAKELTAMGHTIQVVEMNASVQAIAIGPDGLTGWADPRRDGTALGD